MSKWQPISTAPANTPVRVGKWEFYGNEPAWKENEGVVWRPRLFGLMKHIEYAGREYQYWQPLPPPPEDEL